MTWYNEDWSYRKQVTINGDYISGSHTNFPVLYRISGIGNNSLGNGTDIVFVDNDDTTRLHHELISFKNYTGNAWVQIPSLVDLGGTDKGQDKIFYMYYGNLTGGDQTVVDGYRPSSTWDDTYSFVTHMRDSGSNTRMIIDSTKYRTAFWKKYNGYPTGTACFLGSCQKFTASDGPLEQSLISSNSTNGLTIISSQVTFSIIVSGTGCGTANFGYFVDMHKKPTNTSVQIGALYWGGDKTTSARNNEYIIISSQNKRTATGDTQRYWPSTNINRTSTLGLSYSSGNIYGSIGQGRTYNEGKIIRDAASFGVGNLMYSPPNGIIIGQNPNLDRPYSGCILDVQVLNKAKSTGWFEIKNYNISSLSAGKNYIFYTIGSEEEPSTDQYTGFFSMSGSATGWTWGKVLKDTGSAPRSTTGNGTGWTWGVVDGTASMYIPCGQSTGWKWCPENAGMA